MLYLIYWSLTSVLMSCYRLCIDYYIDLIVVIGSLDDLVVRYVYVVTLAAVADDDHIVVVDHLPSY